MAFSNIGNHNKKDARELRKDGELRGFIEPKCVHGNPEALCGECASQDFELFAEFDKRRRSNKP